MDWLCLTEISFDRVKHLPVKPTSGNYRAIACYDGTEICTESAFEMLKVFSSQEREEGLDRARLHETD